MAQSVENETARLPLSPPKFRFLKTSLVSGTLLFLAVTVLYLRGVLPPSLYESYQDALAQNVMPSEDLGHVLHPEDHIYRSASTFHHEWVITESPRRPDGVLKNVYLINGLLPGPPLEARSGDTVIINVVNNLTQGEGISIHWHGLYMRLQNQYDGAAGFTQNPIPPWKNLTYRITIAEDQWGTFWYHADDQVQRADGLFGALIVHRPANEDSGRQYSLQEYQSLENRLLMVGDWYHRSADDVLKWYMSAGSFGNDPAPDSILVNGKGAYNCSMAVPARPVDCEQRDETMLPKLSLDARKRYRLRVINHGSLAGITIGTNAASLRAVEVDGGNEISADAQTSSVGVLYPGQRVDLIVTPYPNFNMTNSDPLYLSISLDRENFKYPNPALTDVQYFPMEIADAPKSSLPAPQNAIEMMEHFDLESATALDPSPLSQAADGTMVVYTTTQKLSHLHNVPHGFMNQTSWKPQKDPSTPLIYLPRVQWDKNQFVPKINGSSGAASAAPWVDLVVNNLDDGGHPFHIHGHDVYVLSSYSADRGWGSYSPFDTSEAPPGGAFNLLNPVKRDTFFVPRRGYTVVRFRADNKGIWMFHCHLSWHQASGMAMGLEIY